MPARSRPRPPRGFPRRRRDRQILMKSIRMLLDDDRVYSEAEINEALQAWRRDVAPSIDVRATIAAYLDHQRRRRPR
ncbi:MAG: DUF2087 domain-containing protein [Myxococcota bacterium]|nr:DUF2087 domain-containing protein [Myxococcota bacterium]